MPSRVLNGIAASDGVAIAESYRLVDPDLSFKKVKITDVNAQATRLSAALVASKKRTLRRSKNMLFKQWVRMKPPLSTRTSPFCQTQK